MSCAWTVRRASAAAQQAADVLAAHTVPAHLLEPHVSVIRTITEQAIAALQAEPETPDPEPAAAAGRVDADTRKALATIKACELGRWFPEVEWTVLEANGAWIVVTPASADEPDVTFVHLLPSGQLGAAVYVAEPAAKQRKGVDGRGRWLSNARHVTNLHEVGSALLDLAGAPAAAGVP